MMAVFRVVEPRTLETFTNVSEVFAASMVMEAARTSETSVSFYQSTRRNNPEDSYLHTRRRENLKSRGNQHLI
jgi:hypothetical protein